MNNTRIMFVVTFLIVATLLFSAFVVAQQAHVRRMPTGGDGVRGVNAVGRTGIQRDGLKNTGIQWDGSRNAGVKLQEGPLAKPKPSLKLRSVETQGVVLPDFKPAEKTETKGMIDPNFKPMGRTERRGIIWPDFAQNNEATGRIVGAVGLESSMKKNKSSLARRTSVKITPIAKQGVEQKGMIDPSFKPSDVVQE